MNNFNIDKDEISSILSSVYDTEYDVDKNKINIVLDYIASAIGNEYLDGRGSVFKQTVNKSKELGNLLTALYDDCCGMQKCNECVISKYCNSNIRYRIENYDYNSPVIIDLFCGAGGLSLGFTQSGFITSLANDIEPCCIDTYSHNHPETPRENIILGDINNVIDNLKELQRFAVVDVVVGGPPCQGFSMANRQRLIDDPRNILYKSYVNVVSIVKPKFFVMENVKGMKSVASQVIDDFENIGYTVSCRILNGKDYGVPQNRERLIFIGNIGGINNDDIFDEIEESSRFLPETVLADALFGLRELKASRNKNATEINSEISGRKIERKSPIRDNEYISLINQGRYCPVVFNHKSRYNNDRDIEIYRRLEQGNKSDDPKIADIMPYGRRNGIFRDKYFKLEENKICKTITAHMKFDCNMYIHPTQARGLTPREAARVQSYPDDYFFRGAYTKTYMQIGNSVPPLLARAIAKVIKKYL
ncbi:DNA cytosine methyltransferase [Sedimentibacter sp.]|uniref:DNA cytosine methyltransferase n=1 Tax=Sedimentibacter sp. TaxID=1960295 RepID=UPI0028AA4DDF|nr:DNA cytosine methyltransferase [Sedimentibacter sp.]